MWIDSLQLLPCKKCGKTFDRWDLSSPEIPGIIFDCADYPATAASLRELVLNATTEWHKFPDISYFADAVERVIGDAKEWDDIFCDLKIWESLFYCPDCEFLTLRAEWMVQRGDSSYANRPHVCECGVELFRIRDWDELRELVIRCPDCGSELEFFNPSK